MNPTLVACVALLVACESKPAPESRPPPPWMIHDMVAVPAGEFMGSRPDCDSDSTYRRWPAERLNLPAFRSIDASRPARTSRAVSRQARAPRRSARGCQALPRRVCLDIHEIASLYCQWRGGNLPSYAQWQRAARGIDGREYPEGSTPSTTCKIIRESRLRRPGCHFISPTGMQYFTQTSLAEWTRDPDCTYPGETGWRTVDLSDDRLAKFGASSSSERFRCVRE